MTEVVRDAGVRAGEPRLEGTRITVLDVKRRVIDEDEDPHVVAGEDDISRAALLTSPRTPSKRTDRKDATSRPNVYATRRHQLT